jgi:hypothetical protein
VFAVTVTVAGSVGLVWATVNQLVEVLAKMFVVVLHVGHVTESVWEPDELKERLAGTTERPVTVLPPFTLKKTVTVAMLLSGGGEVRVMVPV